MAIASDLHAMRETANESAYEKYMLRDAPSVRARLQQVIDARATLSALDDSGNASMLTVPLLLDGDALWIDVPPSDTVQRAMLASGKLFFEGALERVTLRFSCGPAQLGNLQGRPALRMPMPSRLLHLQRREFMRREPPAGALRCVVLVHDGVSHMREVAATIRDIGGGGLAVLVPDDAVEFKVGDLFPGCRITLPDAAAPVDVTLRVQHVHRATVRGRTALQAGCQFVDLRPDAQTRLFRYVMQLDREQAIRRRERE